MIVEQVGAGEDFIHFASMFWKVVFATVPPPSIWGGKLCFIIALTYIGLVTAIVGEFATILGCVLGIDDSITAITLVALGTSLPDTFASMAAAKKSKYADSAIGNITGSNSVNVFLGLGLPWVIATEYFRKNLPGQPYKVPAGNLSYSVFVFLVCAVTCFIVLGIRRHVIGGELGGPYKSKMMSTAFLVFLWIVYIVLSIIDATAAQSTTPDDSNSTLLIAMAPSSDKVEVPDSKFFMWSGLTVLFGATMYIVKKGKNNNSCDDDFIKV